METFSTQTTGSVARDPELNKQISVKFLSLFALQKLFKALQRQMSIY